MRCFTNCTPHLPDSHDSHDNHDGMIVFKLHRPECKTARPDAPSGSWQFPCFPGRALRSLRSPRGAGNTLQLSCGSTGTRGAGNTGTSPSCRATACQKRSSSNTRNWELVTYMRPKYKKSALLHELCSALPRLPYPDSRTMTGH